MLKKNETILFMGDSITDCEREYENISSMGFGYPIIIASILGAKYPELNLNFINKGISGNRSKDLVERWDEDVIKFNPDILTIFVGINDTWRKYDHDDETTVEEYERNYRIMLDKTKEKTNAQIIMISPYVLPFPEDRKAWREDLDPKIAVVEKLAKEYGAIYVKMDEILNKKCDVMPPDYWTIDGVHPTCAGHGVIANELLEIIENL